MAIETSKITPSLPITEAEQALETLKAHYRETTDRCSQQIEKLKAQIEELERENQVALEQLEHLDRVIVPMTPEPDTVQKVTEQNGTGDALKTDSKAPETEAIVEDKKPSSTKKKSSTTKKSSSTKVKAKTKTRNTTRLPACKELEKFETVADAIVAYFKENKGVVSTNNVLDFYYPDGLTKAERDQAYGAISNALSKGHNKKGWVRTSPGKYKWKGLS